MGSLYLDDFHSFDYRNGKFAHIQYTFSYNKLISKILHLNTSFTTNEWIERIIIIGLQNKPAAITLQASGGDNVNLDFKYEASMKALTIRRPAINVLKEFIISLS